MWPTTKAPLNYVLPAPSLSSPSSKCRDAYMAYHAQLKYTLAAHTRYHLLHHLHLQGEPQEARRARDRGDLQDRGVQRCHDCVGQPGTVRGHDEGSRRERLELASDRPGAQELHDVVVRKVGL